MIDILVSVLILCLVVGLIIWVIRILPIPEPFGTVVQAIIALIFVIWLLGVLLGGLPGMRFR